MNNKNQKQEIKELHLKMLNRYLDKNLLEFNFVRKQRQIKYERSVDKTKQDIFFYLRFPSYSDSDFLVTIEPFVSVSIPEISKALIEISGGDEDLLPGTIEPTIHQNAGLNHPGIFYTEWRIRSSCDFHLIGETIDRFTLEYIIPFMERFATAESIAQAYVDKEKLDLRGPDWTFQFTAAYFALGKYQKAYDILEAAFKKPRSLNLYKYAFDYIKERINSEEYEK